MQQGGAPAPVDVEATALRRSVCVQQGFIPLGVLAVPVLLMRLCAVHTASFSAQQGLVVLQVLVLLLQQGALPILHAGSLRRLVMLQAPVLQHDALVVLCAGSLTSLAALQVPLLQQGEALVPTRALVAAIAFVA
jgi:hypothetical protein